MEPTQPPSPRILNSIELRVLGSIIEKEITTPEYAPLTLNATVAACNQKNNRDPVLSLSAAQVQEALDNLRRARLVVQEISQEARVPKYRQNWTALAGLESDERAVMAELILRGPQTLGELRGRCARMHEFPDLNQVELTLAALAERPVPLVAILPRQPGTKERRYAHLLGGPVEAASVAQASCLHSPSESAAVPSAPSEIDELRQEVARLHEEMADLRRQFQDFRRQFE